MKRKHEILWDDENSIDLNLNLTKKEERDNAYTMSVIKTKSTSGLCRDIGRVSGIYKIVNNDNGKYYVGSSDDITRRIYEHSWLLSNKKHHCIPLQKAWEKYGQENFVFVIVEVVSPKLLLETEQKYLDICKQKTSINYNTCYEAMSPMKGRKHSEKTKKLMSTAHRGEKCHWFGKPKTLEERKMVSDIAKQRIGNKNGFFGKQHTPEFVEKMRRFATGRVSLNRKSVIAYNETETKSFDFMAVAAEQVDGTRQWIRKAIKNNVKYKGYFWKYRE